MTKKLCTSAGCRAIIDHSDDGSSPRCDKHQRKNQITPPEDRQRKYSHHYENGKNIYHLARWKRLRARKAALNPICEHCESNGIAKPLQEVDHVIEIEDGGAVWDIGNLQSLCRRHHKIKTDLCKIERNRKRDEFGYII